MGLHFSDKIVCWEGPEGKKDLGEKREVRTR